MNMRAVARACLLVVVLFGMAGAAICTPWVRSVSAAPSDFDFEVLRGEWWINLQSDQWKIGIDAVYVLKPTRVGAREIVIQPQPMGWGASYPDTMFNLDEVSPQARVVERASQRGQAPEIVVSFLQPCQTLEPFDFTISGELVTDRTAYPSQRLLGGVTPEGVYSIPWQMPFYFYGRITPSSYEHHRHVTLPEGWITVPSSYTVDGDSTLWTIYAGPYNHSQLTVYGKRFDVYWVSQGFARDISLWVSQCWDALRPLLGPPSEALPWRFVELPRYHCGGEASRSSIAFVSQLTPGLSPIGQMRDLIYHEIGHKWGIIGGRIEGWPTPQESLTEYKVYLALEQAYGRETAVSFLLSNREWYLRQVDEHGDVPVALSKGTAQSPLTHAVRYEKASWIWHSLRFLMGDDRFFPLLHDLRYEFTPKALTRGTTVPLDDLTVLISNRAGEDLDWFVRQWLFRTAACQFRVEGLRSSPHLGRAVTAGDSYLTRFRLLSMGSVHPPRVELLLVGDSGTGRSQQLVTISLTEGTNSVEIDTRFRVDEVIVDPNKWFLVVEGSGIDAK